MKSVRVFAPATVANLGPGFDILGLALPRPGDVVEATLQDRGVQIDAVTGDGGALSTDASQNVAGVAAADVIRRARGQAHTVASRLTPGVRLTVHKQMPLASGLGSSAASAAAAALAVNALLGDPLSKRELVSSAMEGERVASGSAHADNVAPSLLGGIVLIRGYDPLDLVTLPVPPALWVAVVHPHCSVKTSDARTLVSSARYAIAPIVANLGNVAALVSALFTGDLALLGRAIQDQIVEPVRAGLIPGFDAVKREALAAGALGSSISGAGPSVFAFADRETVAHRAADAMSEAFTRHGGLESDAYVGLVNTRGAEVLS
jgi:homoserine kinase